MGKSKAEIQKAYRERKKQKEGEAYLKKERERVKGYYVPIEEKPQRKANERRKKVREWVRQHRLKKKNLTKTVANNLEQTKTVANNLEQCSEISSSSDVTSTVNIVTEQLIVKLPSLATKKRTRTRVNRANAKHRRTIADLTDKNELLNRKIRTVSKRYQRLINREKKTQTIIRNPTTSSSSRNSPSTSTSIALTPRKRTIQEIREEGLTPHKVPKKIQEKLLFANVITEEIGAAWKSNGLKGKHVLKKIVNGEIIKKYKMKKMLGIKSGIRRHHFKATVCSNKLLSFPLLRKRVESREILRGDVVTFLERDDNSRMMPGKNDKKKTETGHIQKRVLNDSMLFLHLKFKTESPKKISLATFCRLRPKHICLTKHLSRNKCLCQKHQNMALALKNMKTSGANVTINPDEFVRQLKDKPLPEILSEIRNENVRYEQWKKVEMADGKKRTKIVEREETRDSFISIVHTQVRDFQEHVSRVRLQYQALNNLKENLPCENVIVQMDFAENFSCTSADEVQSAYWNSSAVTLHPVVVYFKNEQKELEHKNYVFVSDDLGHNIGSVYTIIQKLLSEIKNHVNNLKVVHYWTDSPSSQYRNKTAFYIVSDHKNIFGVNAIWNYFETGHGKGPCDGIGGTSKRTADLAVRQGKITVQDAPEYFERVQKHHTSAKYIYYNSTECTDSRLEISEFNKHIIPLKGTMQVHCMVGVSKGIVKTTVTSCYCEECLIGNFHDYSESNILKGENAGRVVVPEKEANINQNEHVETAEVEADRIEILIAVDQFVAAIYDNAWHVGKITDIDETDKECQVNFLRPSQGRNTGNPLYKWPNPEDKIWLQVTDILCNIREPNKVGRSGRSFEIDPQDYRNACSLLQLRSNT
ncbi:uncharacterized protein [Mytilus edulis]|uniref:uncharacterized protein n=1 Tax=Mytilus edulis TaxID=6550 RepID=UPI0039EEC50F